LANETSDSHALRTSGRATRATHATHATAKITRYRVGLPQKPRGNGSKG